MLCGKTKLLSILFFSLLISGTLLSVAGDVTSSSPDDDYSYVIDAGHATITGYSGPGGAIVIPSELGGYEVQAIGNRSFEECNTITSVAVLGNISVIGEYAFSACSELATIAISGNVTSIGIGAFLHCYSLAAIDVDGSNTNYSSIEGLLYDKNATTLIQCPGGKSGVISLPDSVSFIGTRAFNTCPFVTSISLPMNISGVGEYSFLQCNSLTSIDVDGSNMNYSSIGGLLYNKNATTLLQCPGGKAGAISLPDSITSIGNWACSYCPLLTSVVVPKNVTSIGFAAFYSSSSLTSITFLGAVAPSYVGDQWLLGTSSGIVGHAYAASDFPAVGGNFFGLTMGAVITVVPSAPGYLVVTLSDEHAVLTWNVPNSDGGYAITNYTVYRSTAENGTYSSIASVTERNYTDTDLAAGQTYWYKVVASNEKGEGAMSTVVSLAVPGDDDPTMIYAAAISIIAIMLVLAFILLKRRKKG